MSLTQPAGANRFESHLAPAYQRAVTSPASEIDVSIVMPCLNEAEAIKACIDEALASLAAMDLTGEVLVVDNGSSDGSVGVATAAGARVVHETARGYGNACRRGLREARGRFLVLGDADGTYDFSALPSFVTPLFNGADMVVGNRLNSDMESGAMPFLHRRLGNPFLTWVLNSLFLGRIGDAHCGLRSIKRESVQALSLSSPGMEFASEFIVRAMQHGVRIEQVPIRYRRRLGGDPKLRTVRDGLRHLRLLLMIRAGIPRSRERVPVVVINRAEVVDNPDLNGPGERDADRIRL